MKNAVNAPAAPRRPKYPYQVWDTETKTTVCIYKSMTVAHRDAEKKNAAAGSARYYAARNK